MNTVIVLAGGTGNRVGAGVPKQFIEVLGKPVLAYTTELFQNNARIDKIVMVCHKDWMNYCSEMVTKYQYSKVKWIVPGGDTFQASVMNGIAFINNLPETEVPKNSNVYVQYGAAPFTSDRIINSVIDMTEELGSAVTGTPCYQLMGTRDSKTESRQWVDRDKYIQLACPYGFRFSYLLDIYKRAEEHGLIDCIEPHTTSLMYALGDKINLAYGDQTNIKITTHEDVELFELYVIGKNKKELNS